MPVLSLQATRPGATQNVSVGASSTQSTAFSVNVGMVRLCSTTACHVAFGSAPTATATSLLLPASSPEFFTVLAGEKVAVIQDAAGGTLNVVEMA